MKHTILLSLTLAIFGISCQKNVLPGNQPTLVQYMSLSAASTWNYELINNILATTVPYTIISTSRDSAINGKSYHVFTNSSGSANEYYNITGNDYYNYRNVPADLGGSSVEYLYLKDNAAMGANWSQTFPITVSGVPLNAIFVNTITEKGISKTIKGITYHDVIHVTTTVTFSGISLTAGQFSTDIQSYYAVKTGLIQSTNIVKLNYLGNISNTDQQTNLNSANIK